MEGRPDAFWRHSSGVRWGKSRPPGRSSSGVRCTIGAPSAWIFLVRLHACRAGLRFSRRGEYSRARGTDKASWGPRSPESGGVRRTRPVESPAQRRGCRSGEDAPQEFKKKFGRPWRRCLDFLLLIGALRGAHTQGFASQMFAGLPLSCKPANCLTSFPKAQDGLLFPAWFLDPGWQPRAWPLRPQVAAAAALPRTRARSPVRYGTGERRKCYGRGTCTRPRSAWPPRSCCAHDRGT